MYGLLQAGALANAFLNQHLTLHAYLECYHTPGLWQHKTWPFMFDLVFDHFSIQYTGKETAYHLLETLLSSYKLSWLIGMGAYFVALTGIMISGMLHFPCWAM
jgi:hypothetical protein